MAITLPGPTERKLAIGATKPPNGLEFALELDEDRKRKVLLAVGKRFAGTGDLRRDVHAAPVEKTAALKSSSGSSGEGSPREVPRRTTRRARRSLEAPRVRVRRARSS